MEINIKSFIDSLGYMAKGMLGIFIVTAAIILSVILMNKLFNK